MKAIVLWSLDSSEAVKTVIKESYKQTRQGDDRNQPLSVQPWGRDGDKRRFWLIEGQDDTHFRLYRESNPALKTVTWRSLAGSIQELQQIAERLGAEDTQAARQLRDRILAAIPRFEAGEDVRFNIFTQHFTHNSSHADILLETQAERLSTSTESTVQTGRTRLVVI